MPKLEKPQRKSETPPSRVFDADTAALPTLRQGPSKPRAGKHSEDLAAAWDFAEALPKEQVVNRLIEFFKK